MINNIIKIVKYSVIFAIKIIIIITFPSSAAQTSPRYDVIIVPGDTVRIALYTLCQSFSTPPSTTLHGFPEVPSNQKRLTGP